MKVTAELRNAITLYQLGKEDAFNTIYEGSKNYIFTCIYKVVCSQENAYDVASEILNDTFLEISQGLFKLQDVEKYLSWAGTIATRRCFDYLRKNKYYNLETELDEDFPEDDNFIPETIMQNREKQLIVKQIIDTNLSEMQKLCIVAYYYNDMKQSDIANELGIPENSVKTHLSRAKSKIKDAVIDIEEKQSIKLYSLAPLMLLLLPIDVDACGLVAPASVPALTAGKGLAETAAGVSQTISGGATAVAKIGGVTMKTKAIIAALSSVLCVGAVVGTIAVTNNNKNNSEKENKTQIETSVSENTYLSEDQSRADMEGTSQGGDFEAGLDSTETSIGEIFSMEINDIYMMSGRGILVTGTIASGTVKVGDKIEISGNGFSQLGFIKEIEIYSELVEEASAGNNVGLVLEKGFSTSDLAKGMIISTPSQEALAAEQAEIAANAAVLHPQLERGKSYKIETAKDTMIQTRFVTITNFESIRGKEFGTNHITVSNDRHEDAIFAGFKCQLTNTSDTAYNPCMTDQSAFTYTIDDTWLDMTDHAYVYVEKDGELVTDVMVAPGETVTYYLLGEVDNNKLTNFDRDYLIIVGMNFGYTDTESYSYSGLDFCFDIYNGTDTRRR